MQSLSSNSHSVDLSFSNDMNTFLNYTIVTFVNSSLKDSLPYEKKDHDIVHCHMTSIQVP